VEPYLPVPTLLHGVYKDNFPDKVTAIECNSVLDRVLLFCFFNHLSYDSVIAYNTVSHRTNVSVLTCILTYLLAYLLRGAEFFLRSLQVLR